MEHKILKAMFEGEEPKSIFEVGCASGGLLKDVSDSYSGIRAGGLDICLKDLKEARELFSENRQDFLYHNFYEPFPIPDNEYDIVFTVGTLMYCFKPIPVLEEMMRIAKNKIIIAEFHFPDMDEYGGIGKYIREEDVVETGIGRNYEKIFNKMGVPILVGQTRLGKWIIKANV